jgi:hypothetical protein
MVLKRFFFSMFFLLFKILDFRLDTAFDLA